MHGPAVHSSSFFTSRLHGRESVGLPQILPGHAYRLRYVRGPLGTCSGLPESPVDVTCPHSLSFPASLSFALTCVAALHNRSVKPLPLTMGFIGLNNRFN